MSVQALGTTVPPSTRSIRFAAVNFETPVVKTGTALLLVAEESDLDLRDACAAANDADAMRLALACARLAARVDSARGAGRVVARARLLHGDHPVIGEIEIDETIGFNIFELGHSGDLRHDALRFEQTGGARALTALLLSRTSTRDLVESTAEERVPRHESAAHVYLVPSAGFIKKIVKGAEKGVKKIENKVVGVATQVQQAVVKEATATPEEVAENPEIVAGRRHKALSGSTALAQAANMNQEPTVEELLALREMIFYNRR